MNGQEEVRQASSSFLVRAISAVTREEGSKVWRWHQESWTWQSTVAHNTERLLEGGWVYGSDDEVSHSGKGAGPQRWANNGGEGLSRKQWTPEEELWWWAGGLERLSVLNQTHVSSSPRVHLCPQRRSVKDRNKPGQEKKSVGSHRAKLDGTKSDRSVLTYCFWNFHLQKQWHW